MMFLRNSKCCMIFMLQERKDQKKTDIFIPATSRKQQYFIDIYNHVNLLNVIKYHCYVCAFQRSRAVLSKGSFKVGRL